MAFDFYRRQSQELSLVIWDAADKDVRLSHEPKGRLTQDRCLPIRGVPFSPA